jgi:radical SAM protein with 4Fe4S-binding SPASM domain
MKTDSYAIFWQKLHKRAKNNGFPLRVMFELTYRCNFFCRHCYIPLRYRKYKELKTKDVFYTLDQLADIGCFYLGFTGGEPFMRKDILKILWYAKRKGFEIIIYTNGSLINKKIADELAELRPNKVDITIPGVSKGVFENISQVRGSQEKVFAAINFLYKKKVNLGFKTCVLKENEGETKDIQEFSVSLGALHRLDDMLSRRLDGSEEPYKYRGRLKIVTKSYSQSASLPEGDKVTSKEGSEVCNLENKNRTSGAFNLFKCGVGKTQAAITPLGELKMCLMIDQPRYKINSSLEDGWNRLKNFVSGIKPNNDYQCNHCQLQSYCKWCPAKGWLTKKSFTACDPENQQRAKLAKEEAHHAKKTKI